MIKLRPYQAESTPKIISYIKSNPGKHPVVAYPTGSGKSYCIADLIQYCVSKWGVKVLVLSHVKEILEQNYEAIERYTGYSIGINSAMLSRREVMDVTVAGIQSVYKSPDLFKEFRLVIIDEAHLISTENKTMYQQLFNGLEKFTAVGFTATPFRSDTGYIYGDDDSTMFDAIVCNYTSVGRFNRLIKDGYLAKLTTKRTKLEMDTSGIRMVAGDFSEKQLSDKFDRDAITQSAIKEIIAAGKNRKQWLIFAIDIIHAEHIAEVLLRNGISAAPVHSKMKDIGLDRDKILKDYKDGKYKCLVNVNILTTGFDAPGVDLIAMLRPTNSPNLHVQTLGRGSRISTDKTECLVLDFAGNTNRLGPINNVLVKQKGKGKGGGEPITKTCPGCESILPPALKLCPDCGHEFQFEHGLKSEATNQYIIEDGEHKWLEVDGVTYVEHKKFGAPSSVKVTYICGSLTIAEWICIEHKGYAKNKADHWVKMRGGTPCSTAKELIDQYKMLTVPVKILVKASGKYHTIKETKLI